MITQVLTPFDSTKQAIEGTTSFRANASYSWSWLIEHSNQQNTLISQINSTTTEMNSLAQTVTTKAQEVANNTTTVNQAKLDAQSARDSAIAANNAAQAIYDTFDDRYLGTKTTAPTVDNDGNALQSGALYFNSTSGKLFIYDLVGAKWVDITTIPTLLSSLSDVAFSTKANNDVLQYDSATGKWVNRSFYSKAELDAFIVGKIPKITTPTTKALPRIKADGTLENSAITIDDSGNIGSGTQSFNGFGGSGFKNYIINGNFDIWQRGTSFISNEYNADRWFAQFDGNCTVSKEWVSYNNTVKLSWTSAGTYKNFLTSVEDGARKLQDKTLTLSFMAKASTAGICSTYIGRGQGAGISAGIDSATINLTTSWQKFTRTFTMPAYDNVNMTLVVGLISMQLLGSSNTVWIKEVQLEEGSIATPFENRPYSLELSLCKRYARDIGNSSLYGQIGNGFAYSNTSALIEIDVEGMRTTPVIANVLTANLFELEGPARYTASAISINGSATANTNKINLNITSSGLTTGYALGFRNNNTTTNKIILSSEL